MIYFGVLILDLLEWAGHDKYFDITTYKNGIDLVEVYWQQLNAPQNTRFSNFSIENVLT